MLQTLVWDLSTEPRSGINYSKKTIIYDEQTQTKMPKDGQAQGRTTFGTTRSDDKSCVYQ